MSLGGYLVTYNGVDITQYVRIVPEMPNWDPPEDADKHLLEHTEFEILQVLVSLRKRKGITQRDVADRLGVSFQRVSKFERAEHPRIETIHRYAEAIGAPLVIRPVNPPPTSAVYEPDYFV